MLIAVVFAVAAGSSFAVGGVLQQHAAARRPPGEELSVRLLAGLLRHRAWLAGIGLAFLAYALESVALAYGPLIVVQPLIVTELLTALPLSMRWDGMRIGGREWAGAIAVTFGLAVGLVSAAPGAGTALPSLHAWIPALAGTALAATLAVLTSRRMRGPLRASLYAAAAGLVLSLQAALLKSAIALFTRGLLPALQSWQLWAMVAASLVGLLLVQTAYQAGPLALSMPVLDTVGPAVAIILGVLVFREQIRTGLWLIGIAAGLIPLFAGIALLDTSVLRRRTVQPGDVPAQAGGQEPGRHSGGRHAAGRHGSGAGRRAPSRAA
jgi:drug/metabolite transporter (DMT)-like permease